MGVPRDQIYPIMADGDSPEEDTNIGQGKFISQDLDLDFNQSKDINLSATRTNIYNTLLALQDKMQENDHLFVFVTDHGGTTDSIGNSFLYLWNYEKLFDYELAEWLRPFSIKNINVNIVLGQCFSGGFIDNLKTLNCVVATASKENESSWACRDIPYDEFLYHWTCAINQEDSDHFPIISDFDEDGKITMDEAFCFAKTNDKYTQPGYFSSIETPQYASTPRSIGEDLAFNHTVPAVDLYIRDNLEDTGKEPNNTSDVLWLSPDIWIRNQMDGIEEHENPFISSDHLGAIIYVRIHNRGKADFNGSNKWLHLYWARAATGLTAKAFKGYEIDDQGRATGGHLRAVSIPSIKAGESAVVGVAWDLPWDFRNEIGTQEPQQQHFCLLTRIMETSVDDGYEAGKQYFNVRECNHHAQLNVSIIKADETYVGTSVHVRNMTNDSQKYTLEFVPLTEEDSMLYNLAQIDMDMSKPIYDAWQRGGLKFNRVLTNNKSKPNQVTFISCDSRIEDISLNADEFDKVTMRFNLHSNSNLESGKKYTYNLIQRDEEGDIVGGETFIIEIPSLSAQNLEIDINDNEDETLKLSVNDNNLNHVAWFNDANQLIGEGSSIEVSKTSTKQKISVSAFNAEGEMASESVTLESYIGIKKISVESGIATVELKSKASPTTELTLTSLTETTVRSKASIGTGDTYAIFDVSNLNRNSVYIITYSDNGEFVDSQKFSLQ